MATTSIRFFLNHFYSDHRSEPASTQGFVASAWNHTTLTRQEEPAETDGKERGDGPLGGWSAVTGAQG
jgi:hypothetical protein